MILGIAGAGGLGKEVLDLACKINSVNKRWEDIFFIENDPDKLKDGKYCNCDVVNFNDFLLEDEIKLLEVVIANGEPEIRRKIYEEYKKAGVAFATLIHPMAEVSSRACCEEGVVVNAFCTICPDAKIGVNTFLQPHSIVGHDTVIGAHSIVSSLSAVCGSCVIGDCVYVAPNTTIKNEVEVGDYSILGMGAVVFKNVKSQRIVVGNPAKVIGDNTQKSVFHQFD